MNNSNQTKLIKKDYGNVLLVTAITGLGYNMAPHFGMYQIYNYLKHHNIACDLYDRDLEFFKKTDFDENAVLNSIRKGKYDVIGVSVTHNKAYGEQKMISDLDLVWNMKSAAKDSGKMPAFVAGGQAAGLNHKQWLNLGIDLIVLGYGEKTFYDICKKYFEIPKIKRNVSGLIDVAETIRGVSYKTDKKIYRYTPAHHVTDELFKELFLDFPQKYEMPHKIFWNLVEEISADQGLGASEFIYENVRLYTTSHCPRNCGFCNSGQYLREMSASADDLMIDKKGFRLSTGKQKLVQLSAEELVELIMFNIKKYGAKSFLFSDDDFALKSKNNRTKNFCKLVIDYKKKGLIDKNVQFNCQTHVTDWLTGHLDVNEELIKDMAAAGFKSISVGVETFTDGIISSQSINKIGYKSEHAQAVLDVMLNNGIVPQVNVILGVPEYTVQDLIDTMDIAMEYIIKGCDVSVGRQLLAFPGAPIYESGLYKVVYDTWKHPVTGEEVKIPDYFEPKDPIIAKAMEVYDEEAKKELARVVKKMNWGKMNPPKRVIAIAGLTCLPRLLKRNDLIPKYNKILDDVLAGKCRQNAEMAYNPLVDEQQPRLRKFMNDKMSEKNKNINLSYKST